MTRGEVTAVYRDAVAGAGDLWSEALSVTGPDPDAARRLIGRLSAAYDADGDGLIALTEAEGEGQGMLVHMVNVAVLTLAQARSLGIGGPLLETIGMAALLHDIGKVRTPADILATPGPLTPTEFASVKRHVIDGESILRRTAGMPSLAAVVAFEHHLKHDGSGYPEGVRRPLNACTSLVAISDVFDALRGDRPYRAGLTADRIHALMSNQRRGAFHGPLLQHFATMMTRNRDEMATVSGTRRERAS
jgi:putative nucleotidyltransferase with HDIG domain